MGEGLAEGVREGVKGEGDGKGKAGRYQEYVRKHFGRVRAENPALGMAGWMVELGRGFREERARGLGGLGDLGAVEGGEGEMDAVARKLDFLSLCA